MIKKINKSVKGGQKAKNDDCVFCKTYDEPLFVNKLNLVAIAAVADGVGGVKGGDKASAIAVKELESRVERHKVFGSLKDIDEFFKNTYKEINQIILQEQENQKFPDMCTTLVSAGLFRKSGTEQCHLFIINAGDSPLFCIDTDRDEIELLSTIHHTGNHLTQYLGKRNLEIHNSYCQCPKNGFILLSSDGLTGDLKNNPLIGQEEIKKYLVETKSIDEASEILIKLAQYKGSSDDISVAILEMGKPKRVKPKHLTPISSPRYRAIAERLVYAGCILISIIVVLVFKSRYDNLNDSYGDLKGKYEKLYKDYSESNKERDDWVSKYVQLDTVGKEKSADLNARERDLTNKINVLKEKETEYKKSIKVLTDKEDSNKKEIDKLKEQNKRLLAIKGGVDRQDEATVVPQDKKSNGKVAGTQLPISPKENGPGLGDEKENSKPTSEEVTGTVPFPNGGAKMSVQPSSDTEAYPKDDSKINPTEVENLGEDPKFKEVEEKFKSIKFDLTVVENKGKDKKPISNAIIYLDDKKIGTTDGKGTLNKAEENVKIGKHTLKVERNGYQTIKNEINIADNLKTEIVLKK